MKQSRFAQRPSASILTVVGLLAIAVPAHSAPKYTQCELALLEATLEKAPPLSRKTFLKRHLPGMFLPDQETVSAVAWGVMAAAMRSVVARASTPPAFEFDFGHRTLKDLVAPFLSDFDSITKNDRQSSALAAAFVHALTLELSARVTRFPFGEIAVDGDGTVLRVEAFESEATLPRVVHSQATFMNSGIDSEATRRHAWSLIVRAWVSMNDGRFKVEIGQTKIRDLLEPFAYFLAGDLQAQQKLVSEMAGALTGHTNVFPFGTIQIDSNGVVRDLKPASTP